MTLTRVEQLAALLAAASLIVTLGTLVIFAVRLRRRWRSRRTMFHAVLGPSLRRIPLSRLTESVVSNLVSPSWWRVQRDRHTMWRSVTAARRAVSVAKRADAPIGDLPMLTRRLQQAATGVDAALRASGDDRRLQRELTADRMRIEAAAADIRAAAVASLGVTRVEVQPVVSTISAEVAALAAGVRAARSLGS